MQESVSVPVTGVAFDAVLAFIFAFIGFLFLGNLAYLLLRRALDGHASRGTAKWTAAILQYGITIGGIYASARYLLAFDLTAFVASLGILGIVIAFSSRQIIQNVIAGILITINRPVQLEEWVIASGRPETGLSKVQDISFTTTILQGLDGGLVLTPNSSIISSKVINYSRAGLLEVLIPIAVPVTANLERVREIALRAAHDHPLILPHVEPAERSAIQSLFDLPYIGRLSSDLPHPGPCDIRAEGADCIGQGGVGQADGKGLDPTDPKERRDRLGVLGYGHRAAEGRGTPREEMGG